jgi:hypothetical protein
MNPKNPCAASSTWMDLTKKGPVSMLLSVKTRLSALRLVTKLKLSWSTSTVQQILIQEIMIL